jgi:hypothetical protein
MRRGCGCVGLRWACTARRPLLLGVGDPDNEMEWNGMAWHGMNETGLACQESCMCGGSCPGEDMDGTIPITPHTRWNREATLSTSLLISAPHLKVLEMARLHAAKWESRKWPVLRRSVAP